MAWYDKYMAIYGKRFNEIPQELFIYIREKLSEVQSPSPMVSIVVIAYNEECRLLACLWSLSELKTKYPIEIIGVNNNSCDKTEDIYKAVGISYYNEKRQSPGFARQCGLEHVRGKYYFCIDSDTLYPTCYVDLMMEKLLDNRVSCVSSFWSFFPDENHSSLALLFYESIRDLFLFIQSIKRPELSVRGMVFAFKVDYAKKVNIRTDIRRGEDGSLALSLKKYGKIAFLYSWKSRPVTGYGTIGDRSLWHSFIDHVKIQMKGISRIFYQKDHYEDSDDNLINSRQ